MGVAKAFLERLRRLEATLDPGESPVIVLDAETWSDKAVNEADQAWRKRNPGRGEPLIILCHQFKDAAAWEASQRGG